MVWYMVVSLYPICVGFGIAYSVLEAMREPCTRDKQSSRFPRFFICLLVKPANPVPWESRWQNKKNMITKPELKLSKVPKWSLPKKKNIYYQQLLQNDTITWSVLMDALNTTETFFVDDCGWTISPIRKDGIPKGTAYMFCGFEIKTKNGRRQHFYAWRQRKNNGEMGCIQFGARLKFESIIIEQIDNQ